jgi:hypothetical protein
MPRGLRLPTRTRLLIHDQTSEQTTHSRDSRESNASNGILLLLPGALGGAPEQVVAWRLNLFKIKIVVDGFLAPYTKCGPRHRGKPLWVDLLIALLARPEVAFLDTTERRTSVSKLVKLTVEITNRECAFGSRLDLLQLIGASLNRDPLAVAGEAFQFSNLCR